MDWELPGPLLGEPDLQCEVGTERVGDRIQVLAARRTRESYTSEIVRWGPQGWEIVVAGLYGVYPLAGSEAHGFAWLRREGDQRTGGMVRGDGTLSDWSPEVYFSADWGYLTAWVDPTGEVLSWANSAHKGGSAIYFYNKKINIKRKIMDSEFIFGEDGTYIISYQGDYYFINDLKSKKQLNEYFPYFINGHRIFHDAHQIIIPVNQDIVFIDNAPLTQNPPSPPLLRLLSADGRTVSVTALDSDAPVFIETRHEHTLILTDGARFFVLDADGTFVPDPWLTPPPPDTRKLVSCGFGYVLAHDKNGAFHLAQLRPR